MFSDKARHFLYKISFYLLCTIALVWFGFLAWDMAWPLSWSSSPVALFFVLCAGRILFEITFNRGHIPTMATSMAARKKMAALIMQDQKEKNNEPYNVIDLGSGRGELARRIAKSNVKLSVTGVEIARFPFWESFFIQKFLGPRNLSYQQKDLWGFDCSAADAIVLYTGPLSAQKVGKKIRKEAKTGSLIISNTYPLSGDWVPTDILQFRSPFQEKIYIYRQD